MADRALLAGYPRYVVYIFSVNNVWLLSWVMFEWFYASVDAHAWIYREVFVRYTFHTNTFFSLDCSAWYRFCSVYTWILCNENIYIKLCFSYECILMHPIIYGLYCGIILPVHQGIPDIHFPCLNFSHECNLSNPLIILQLFYLK